MNKINDATVDLVKEFEGFREWAYLDGGGVWTIGYGTTAAAGLGIAPKAGMKISKEQAEVYLFKALDTFATKIEAGIKAPINENEFGAFLSLAYNIGPDAFLKSTALRKFNAGDKAGAAAGIKLFNKDNGKVVKGLVRRRDAEVVLFLTPIEEPKQWWSGLIKSLTPMIKK